MDHLLNVLPNVRIRQRSPQFIFRVNPKRIQVEPHSAREDMRVLRNDGDDGPRGLQIHLQERLAIDENVAVGDDRQPQQGDDRGAFATASATTDTNLCLLSDQALKLIIWLICEWINMIAISFSSS